MLLTVQGSLPLLISMLGTELSGCWHRHQSTHLGWPFGQSLLATVFHICVGQGREGDSQTQTSPRSHRLLPSGNSVPFPSKTFSPESLTMRGEGDCSSSAAQRLFTRVQTQAFKAFFLCHHVRVTLLRREVQCPFLQPSGILLPLRALGTSGVSNRSLSLGSQS